MFFVVLSLKNIQQCTVLSLIPYLQQYLKEPASLPLLTNSVLYSYGVNCFACIPGPPRPFLYPSPYPFGGTVSPFRVRASTSGRKDEGTYLCIILRHSEPGLRASIRHGAIRLRIHIFECEGGGG